MKALVIGASGHVGSYMTVELVKRGYEVTAVSRGRQSAYLAEQPQWRSVRMYYADRKQMEQDGSFGAKMMATDPDVVIDLISYTKAQAEHLAEAAIAYGKVRHLIQIGSIWSYGACAYRPCSEHHMKKPQDEYGKGKAEIETYLMGLSKRNLLSCTVIHPGHVSGEGWLPINPQGNLDVNVYQRIARGESVTLPDDGLATLNHVHAYDVAALTCACLDRFSASAGESFNSVCACSMTLRGFAEEVYAMFGHKPAIEYLAFSQLMNQLDPQQAEYTAEHIKKSLTCSMEKAKTMLGFTPMYDTVKTVEESLRWQILHGKIRV